MAIWLQARSQWANPDVPWKTVYLVAGATDQDSRLSALRDWLKRHHQPDDPVAILIGNDPVNTYWSSTHQRNLTRSEWAVIKVFEMMAESNRLIEVVPGTFYSTDEEMEVLASYLADRPEIKRVALVTCRFHGRRVLARFRRYSENGLEVALIPGKVRWKDRYPQIVGLELLKLMRDWAGLTRVPVLTREWWLRQGDKVNESTI